MSLVSAVITARVRALVNDAASASWTDAQLLLWYNDAVRTIRQLRPETKTSATGTEIAMVEATALGDTRLLDDVWMPAEADYVAARAFEMDAGDTREAERARHHWQNFQMWIASL